VLAPSCWSTTLTKRSSLFAVATMTKIRHQSKGDSSKRSQTISPTMFPWPCRTAQWTWPTCHRVPSLGAFLELIHIFPAHLRGRNGSRWLDPRHFGHFITHRGGTWFFEELHPFGLMPVTMLVSNPDACTDMVNRLKRLVPAPVFFPATTVVNSSQRFTDSGPKWSTRSQRNDTGYVPLSLEPGRFEFFVADHGIGVLTSLRSSPSYAYLTDHD